MSKGRFALEIGRQWNATEEGWSMQKAVTNCALKSRWCQWWQIHRLRISGQGMYIASKEEIQLERWGMLLIIRTCKIEEKTGR